MEARNDYDRTNISVTGEYTLRDFKANGRNYYHNGQANTYLYSSPRGIWFVCEYHGYSIGIYKFIFKITFL